MYKHYNVIIPTDPSELLQLLMLCNIPLCDIAINNDLLISISDLLISINESLILICINGYH